MPEMLEEAKTPKTRRIFVRYLPLSMDSQDIMNFFEDECGSQVEWLEPVTEDNDKKSVRLQFADRCGTKNAMGKVNNTDQFGLHIRCFEEPESVARKKSGAGGNRGAARSGSNRRSRSRGKDRKPADLRPRDPRDEGKRGGEDRRGGSKDSNGSFGNGTRGGGGRFAGRGDACTASIGQPPIDPEDKIPGLIIKNLPWDMEDGELDQLAAKTFGSLARKTQLFRMQKHGPLHGRVVFKHAEDAMRMLQEFEDRTIEGSDNRMRCWVERNPNRDLSTIFRRR